MVFVITRLKIIIAMHNRARQLKNYGPEVLLMTYIIVPSGDDFPVFMCPQTVFVECVECADLHLGRLHSHMMFRATAIFQKAQIVSVKYPE